jgi:hypothetical protein
MPADQRSRSHHLGSRRGIADQAAVAESVRVERVAEVRWTHRGVTDLAEICTAASRPDGKSRSAMMAAAEMPVTMATSAMAAAMVSTPMMTPAVAATMTTAMPALGKSRARKHAGHRNGGNSNDRSQHLILPQSAALRHWKLTGIGTSARYESSARSQRSGNRAAAQT